MRPDEGLPLRSALPAIADPAFDRIAALVRTVIDVPVALVSLVDRDGQVFPGASGLGEPWQSTRGTPLSHSFCQHVVRSAQPLIVTDARTDPRVAGNLAVPDIGVVGYAGMPLIDLDGQVVGSLCAIDVEPRDWTPAELALLADLAAACSAELQLRSSVRRADASFRRTTTLLALAETLGAATSVAEVSRVISELSRTHLDVAFGAIVLLDEGGLTLRYADLDAIPPELRSSFARFSIDRDTPSAIAARTLTATFIDNTAELAARMPDTATAIEVTGGRSGAFLPLYVGGRTLGALSLLWAEPRTFTVADRELIDGLARYTAQAVDRASLLAERRNVAHTLQAALLPRLPDVGWLAMTGRYRAANASDAVGGDWYDAFTLADKTLVLAVGDVSGHDSAAAAAMGQIRTTLRVLALDAPDTPAAVLSRLDRIMPALGHDRLATVVIGALSCADDGVTSLAWSNAGHLPPLLLAPGEAARFLTTPADRLLGLRDVVGRHTHQAVVPPGSTLLLYTDGLVERRRRDLQDGLDALAYAADAHRERPLPEMIDAVLSAALAGGQDDDTVILGVRTAR